MYMNITRHFFLLITLLGSLNTLGATTYYVNASEGDDQHCGTHAEKAWQTLEKLNSVTFTPGDKILFKAGEMWVGSFTPKGSGKAGAPIIVDRYGEGNRPILDGKGQVDHVIRLENIDHWELYNLEITNNSQIEGDRIGVFIVADSGVRRHFRLRNLFIHHIMGRYTFDMVGKNTGGIGIIGKNDTRFDDILIEHCVIGDLVRVGIFTNGNEGVPGDRPITNLIIRNNTIYRCAGDGAIIRFADKPLIERNEAYENHNGPQDLVIHGVALWCRSTDGAIFQFNHVHHTVGDKDGQAFDADLEARDTIVQYNYSHDNAGGFMLVYGSSRDAIVRYNISYNDGYQGKHIFDFPIWTEPRGSGIFHNNIIYLPKGNPAVIADEALETARFYNNIFYHGGKGTLLTLDKTNRPYFSNNCYYGYSSEDTDLDANAIIAHPQFVGSDEAMREEMHPELFKLNDESLCIGLGTAHFSSEKYPALPSELKDFFNNPLSTFPIDVGAHAYTAEKNGAISSQK